MTRSMISVVCALGALVLATVASFAKDAEQPAARDEAEVQPSSRRISASAKPTALKVYEWGVETLHWDGTPEPEMPGDVPAFYYDASEVPIEARPEPEPKPEPAPPSPVRPPVARKPVVYFESEKDVVFDFQVKFTTGKVTWMYPKPSRRTDEATAQWDRLWVYSDSIKRTEELTLPKLATVAADHWANYSREGSTSSVVINGEQERFLFYEGDNKSLPEIDIFRDAQGRYVLRNYTQFPIYHVRAHLPAKDGARLIYVAKVSAAQGETPAEVKLSDHVVMSREIRDDELAREVQNAGLTQTQAMVFQRCWNDMMIFGKVGTLSYRRDPKTLDAKMPITITGDVKVTAARVGYVWIGCIDPEQQDKLDDLARKAAEGDNESLKTLTTSGAAGIGAARRGVSNTDNGLKLRLAYAKVLKDLEKAWAR